MIRRSKTEWLNLIDEHAASGLSAAEFCRRNDLNPKYFSFRRRELSQTAPAFIELTPKAAPQNKVVVRVTEITVSLADLELTLSALS